MVQLQLCDDTNVKMALRYNAKELPAKVGVVFAPIHAPAPAHPSRRVVRACVCETEGLADEFKLTVSRTCTNHALQRLGRGSFATVVRGEFWSTDRPDKIKSVAVKMMDLKMFKTNKHRDQLQRELDIQVCFNPPRFTLWLCPLKCPISRESCDAVRPRSK